MAAVLPPVFISGQVFNAVGRGTLTGPTLDANTPLSWLYDGFASKPCLCTGYATSGNCDWQLDADLVKALTSPATLTLRAGESYRLTFSGGATGRLQSVLTGLYLQADGTWSTTVTTLTVTMDFTTDLFEKIQADNSTFTLTVVAGSIANIRLWPWIDTMAVFGHNLLALPDTVEWKAADDSGISSGVVTLQAAAAPLVGFPFCKVLATPNKQRYHRIRIVAAPRKPQLSELILAQTVYATTGATQFGRTSAPPVQTSEGVPQTRFDNRYGTLRSYAEGLAYVGGFSAQTRLSAAELVEFQATVLRRSLYGLTALLVIPHPDAAFPTPCQLIRVPDTMTWEENPVGIFTATFGYLNAAPPAVIP